MVFILPASDTIEQIDHVVTPNRSAMILKSKLSGEGVQGTDNVGRRRGAEALPA